MENEVNPEEELKRLHAMYANFAQNAVGQIVLDDLKKLESI